MGQNIFDTIDNLYPHTSNDPVTDQQKKKTELQINGDSDVAKSLRTEFNFLRFPFFDLAKDSKRERITIEEHLASDQGTGHVLWKVTRDIDSKFPGDFEKRLHRAIEQVLNTLPKPVENPIKLGSLRYLAQIMGITPDSGKNRQDIQNGLNNLVKASVEAKGTFQLKGVDAKKKFHNDTFHLYDRVIYTGEELPDGKSADAVYIVIGTWYLQNFNRGYSVPLDWHYYNQLPGTIASRLYEMFCIYFFASIKSGKDIFEIKYSRICRYAPLVPQDQLWKAKKQFKRAHEYFLATKFITEVEWRDTQENQDWKLVYHIGERARQSYELNQKHIQDVVEIPPRRRATQKQQFPARQPETKELSVSTQKIISDGLVAKDEVISLLNRSTATQINACAEALLARINTGKIIDDPTGYFAACVTKEWKVETNSKTKVTNQELEKQKQIKQEKSQKEFENKIQVYRSWLGKSAEERIQPQLDLYIKAHNPTQAQIQKKRTEYLNSPLASDHEHKQNTIFGKVYFKACTIEEFDAEIEELRKKGLHSQINT
ncbi:MAG: hypothetical protein H6696_05545 [Deferribacteres bacterium]|nr:hypothetical protein [candidate division KSB1 bacterium]MCB9501382.1 hypothetical protein [Deferribacteres bacterium]